MSDNDSTEVPIGSDADEKIKNLSLVSTNDLNWTTLLRDPISGELGRKAIHHLPAHASGPSRLETIALDRALPEFGLLMKTEADP
jgi:hypothetical protein